jgi:hypothetical protein
VPELRTIARHAGTVLVGQLAVMAFGVTDTIVAGRYSEQALAATVAWAWLVKWRAGRHRAVIWKSLVLPAGGAALCWLLLMTLWMPLLDYARSYAPLVRNVARLIDAPGCVEVHGLSQAQLAALRYHGGLTLKPASRPASCPWLLVDADAQHSASLAIDLHQWNVVSLVARPSDSNDNVLLYRRASR